MNKSHSFCLFGLQNFPHVSLIEKKKKKSLLFLLFVVFCFTLIAIKCFGESLCCLLSLFPANKLCMTSTDVSSTADNEMF